MRHQPFFQGPQEVVPKLIHEFYRIVKVYQNEVIGGFFAGRVLDIIAKLFVEIIAQAIGCER